MNYLTIFKCLCQPSLLYPNVIVNSILDINFHRLHDYGIKCLIFDRDNTLTSHGSLDAHSEDIQMKVNEAVQMFDDVVIVSNTTKHINVREALGLRVLATRDKKPHNYEQIVPQLKVKVDPHEVCVIGDRLMTDILLSNLNGCVSILVQPFSTENENFGQKICRIIESCYKGRQQTRIHSILGRIIL